MDPTDSSEEVTSPSAASTCESSGPSSASTASSPPANKPLTSLDLLGAKEFATREHTSSPVGDQLEQLTTEILTQASNQAWDHPVMVHVLPDFAAEFDHSNGEKIDSFYAYVRHHRKLVAENPEYHFIPMNASAQIHDSNGTASVHVLLKVIGHPVGVIRESVVIFMWKRREQVWRCYKHKVIRGMHWNV